MQNNHGSNLNYKLDKKKPMVFCVAGAALWDACCSFVWQALGFGSMDGCVAWRLPCNSHATHTQHTVNTTRNTSTFPVNSQSKCASCAKI